MLKKLDANMDFHKTFIPIDHKIAEKQYLNFPKIGGGEANNN